MVYIVNKLDSRTEEVVSVAYDNKSVWDAKGLAIRYIRCFILKKDGKEALSTAFNLKDEDLPTNEPVNRHSFVLNDNTGCLEVYHLTASMINGWFDNYRDAVKRTKVFVLSVSSVDCSSFETATFVPFKCDDLLIKNNTNTVEITGDEEDLSVKKSLMTELREFITQQRVDTDSEDEVEAASSN